MSSDSRSPWLTLNEAARLMGLSARTVRREIERGRLSCWRTPGGHARIGRTDVERYAAENRIPLSSVEAAP